MPTVEQTLKSRRLRNAYAPAIHRVTYGVAIAIICNVQTRDSSKMTLRIEKLPDGPTTTIRLIGRRPVEHLEELSGEEN